jgi:hypothetical protein
VESRRAALPPGIRPPFEVYVNGVRQRPGADYEIRDEELVFAQPLIQEGKLGAKAWALGFWGVGTYKRNDEIDVRYEVAGQPRVAQGLALTSG